MNNFKDPHYPAPHWTRRTPAPNIQQTPTRLARRTADDERDDLKWQEWAQNGYA